MLTRLNLVPKGYCLSQLVLIKFRPIHITGPLLVIKNETGSSNKKDSLLKRSHLSANDLSDMISQRLRLYGQRGLIKTLLIGSGIVIVSTVIFLYAFRKPIKDQTVAQVADVAKSSLEQG